MLFDASFLAFRAKEAGAACQFEVLQLMSHRAFPLLIDAQEVLKFPSFVIDLAIV